MQCSAVLDGNASRHHHSYPVIIDEQRNCRGLIKDISTKGTAVFLDMNLQKVKFVNLHIYLPPLDAATGPRTIEVYGKVVYSLHDSSEPMFRTGISFLKFHQETEQAHLDMCLANYHVSI